MPARNRNSSSKGIQTQKKSALFPSGTPDAETQAAYANMMKKFGSRAVEKKRPQGAVDMTPGAPGRSVSTVAPTAIPRTPDGTPIPEAIAPVPMQSPVPFDDAYKTVETVAVPVDSVRRNKMNEFVKAMNGISASTVYTVKLSDGRELSFESPRVKTQKTLNQIIATNKNDPASQYVAQLSLLETVCLTKGIDWNEISDFDRNKILFSLYRDILFRDEYKYKCDDPECRFEWMGKLDGDRIIANLDKSDVSDRTVKKTLDGIDYELRIGFPKAKAMVGFLTDYGSRKQPVNPENTIDPVTLLEYIDLFIKEVWVRKDGEELAHINLEDMFVPQGTPVVAEDGTQALDALGMPITVDVGQCYRDVVDVLGSLPGTLLQASSDDDVYTKISKLLIGIVNDALPDCVCPKCGHRMGKSFGFNDFFSLG